MEEKGAKGGEGREVRGMGRERKGSVCKEVGTILRLLLEMTIANKYLNQLRKPKLFTRSIVLRYE